MLVQLALRNLIQARRRTLVLGVALALVTMLLVLLFSLSEGISDGIVRSATTLASGHVNVGGFFKAGADDAAPWVRNTAELGSLLSENLPEVSDVTDRVRGWARIVSSGASLQAGLTGIDIRDEKRLQNILQLAREDEYMDGGRPIVLGDLERLARGHQVVLFARQARRLGVTVGDPLTLIAETHRGQRNSGEVTVAAVAKDIGFMSNFSVFADKETLRELYRLDSDITGVIQLFIADYTKSVQTMSRVRRLLMKHGYKMLPYEGTPFFTKFDVVSGAAWRGQRLDLTTWQDEMSLLTWILTAVNSVSATLIFILLLIIVVGVMNSLWISVRERTREVGTLRAIGMSKSRVLGMFVCEAVLLGGIASVVGAGLGAVIAIVIDYVQVSLGVEAMRAVLMSDTLHLVVRPRHIYTSVWILTLVSSLAALLPAYRAAQIQPATALHFAG